MKLLVALLLIALALFGLWRWATATGAAGLLDWVDARFSRAHAVELAASGAYGAHPAQKVELWRPADKVPAPLIVFIHGGGWHSGAPRDYRFVARAMGEMGYATALVGYRLVPEGRFPAMLEDSAAGLRWAADIAPDHGVDTTRIVLMGHSAGAYNAAMLALDSRYLTAAGVDPRRIKVFAGLSGPYDFLPLRDPIAIRTFGEAKDPSATQPTAFARADAPATFLATGEKDTYVFPRNTVRLAKALREVGVLVEERHYPEVDHINMVLAFSRPLRGRAPVFEELVAFLKAHLT